MFRILVKKAVGVGILALFIVPAMAQGRARLGGQQAKSRGNGYCLLQSMPLQTLEETEREWLLQMREEEKLARDVYQTLYIRWSDPIFSRIAGSEQRHMDAVGVLLNRYEIEDPVSGNAFGEFNNPDLQVLYEDLTTIGQQSLSDALRVGATIEDLDLYDLSMALDDTDNSDIRIVYENLHQGSRNHIQAFVGSLAAFAETYTPQYINEAELAAILASYQSTTGAPGKGRGRGLRNNRKGGGMCLQRRIAVSD